MAPAEGEDALYAPSEDSDSHRDKISPQEFTKNVLLECNVIKKPPHHRPMLQGGNSIVSKVKKNPAFLDATSRTFYGRKLSESGALFPAPQPQTEIARQKFAYDTGRASSLRMG